MQTVIFDTTPSGVMVQVHHGAPTDAEWNRMVRHLVQNMSRLIGVLAVATGEGGPNAKQRGALNEVLKRMPVALQFVLLTDSRVARGVLNAINWASGRNAQSHVFARKEVERAMDALVLSPEQAAETLALMELLLERVGVSAA